MHGFCVKMLYNKSYTEVTFPIKIILYNLLFNLSTKFFPK